MKGFNISRTMIGNLIKDVSQEVKRASMGLLFNASVSNSQKLTFQRIKSMVSINYQFAKSSASLVG